VTLSILGSQISHGAPQGLNHTQAPVGHCCAPPRSSEAASRGKAHPGSRCDCTRASPWHHRTPPPVSTQDSQSRGLAAQTDSQEVLQHRLPVKRTLQHRLPVSLHQVDLPDSTGCQSACIRWCNLAAQADNQRLPCSINLTAQAGCLIT
jgi:hypothetical protein